MRELQKADKFWIVSKWEREKESTKTAFDILATLTPHPIEQEQQNEFVCQESEVVVRRESDRNLPTL